MGARAASRGARAGQRPAAPQLLFQCLLIFSAATGAVGYTEPACPLDMDAILPVASYSGTLPSGSKLEDLAGKVALITGASTGIGRGAADRLAAAGMTVLGTSRHPELYAQPCNYTLPGDKCRPDGWQLWAMDQTDPASVDALIKRVQLAYGRIDLLILNAGRTYAQYTWVPDGALGVVCSDVEPMLEVMQTNFLGTLRVLKAALPLLPTKGYARILQTSSIVAFNTWQGGMPYAASKASLRKLAEEWLWEHFDSSAPLSNLHFSTIYPGSVRTDVKRNAIQGCKAAEAAFTPTKYEAEEEAAYSREGSMFVTATEAGEALYRVAASSQPAMQYILNAPQSMDYIRQRICTHLTQPMEAWPKSWSEDGPQGGASPSVGFKAKKLKGP